MTCTLINGDCLVEMDKLIDENVKVDLILTDLPYGTTSCKWDNIIPFEPMWNCFDKLCKPKTPVALFGSEPFSTELRMSNLENFKYDWIWNKEIGTGIFTREYQPLSNYEIISIFYKNGGQYYPIMVKTDKNRSFKSKPNSPKGSTVYTFTGRNVDYVDTGLRFPKRILTFNSQKGECNNINRLHPTQKPVELLEYLIKTYTMENDLVLDCCMGSGSTGVACLQTNRNFIGIELDEKYYNIAKKRCSEYQSKLW